MVFCVIFWQWRFLSVSRNEFWADATTVVLLFLERVNFVFLSVCWTWHRQTPYEGGFLIIWRYGEKVKELIVKKSRHRSFGVPKWINDDNRRRRPTNRLRQSRRRVHPLQWTPQHSAWIRIPEPSRSLAHTSSLRMNPLRCFAVPKPDRQQWETCCWTNECAGGPRALGCDKRLI